jgi:uncharacterized protein YbjQ (UPF0145 family)
MKTPNGNEYKIIDNRIHACLDGISFSPFNSIEEVDAAFTNIPLYQKNINGDSDSYEFKVLMSTTPDIPGRKIKKVIRIIFASSSEIAGFNKQATRLQKTAEASLIALEQIASGHGADAVVGITFSANSSQGGSAALFGSSDAVIAMGTAVLLEDLDN